MGWDGELKIWNAIDITCVGSIKEHESTINYVAISPNGRYIATGGKDRKLHLWDVQDIFFVVEFEIRSVIN